MLRKFAEKHAKVLWRSLLGLLGLGVALFESQTPGDFEIFLAASADLFEGLNPYEQHYHQWYQYYYDLLFASVLYPLNFVSARLAKFIWIVLLELTMLRSWSLVDRWLPRRRSEASRNWERFMLLVFSWNMWIVNFHLQQFTPVLLWMVMEAVHLNARTWKASLVGLGMATKVIPIAVFPLWFLRREWSKSAVALTVFALALVSPVLWLGVHRTTELTQSRWGLLNPTNQEHTFDLAEEASHSLTAWIPTLTSAEARGQNTRPWRRHLVHWDRETVHYVTRGAQLVGLLCVLFFLTAKAFQPARTPGYEWSAVFATVPIVFPHQAVYAFLMCFPAIAWVIRVGWFSEEIKPGIRWKIATLVALTLISLHFYFGSIRAVLNHYKVLTVGAVLLLVCLAQIKPKPAPKPA